MFSPAVTTGGRSVLFRVKESKRLVQTKDEATVDDLGNLQGSFCVMLCVSFMDRQISMFTAQYNMFDVKNAQHFVLEIQIFRYHGYHG